MAVDVLLVVLAVLVPLVLLATNLLVLARYADPDATKEHGLMKALLVLLLLLPECAVLLFPFDVANSAGLVDLGSGGRGGVDVVSIWQALFWLIAVCVVVLLPFCIFYYEELEEGEPGQRTQLCGRNCGRACCLASIYELVVLAIAVIASALLYQYASTASIPYVTAAVSSAGSPTWGTASAPILEQCSSGAGVCACGTGTCSWSAELLTIDTTLVVYLAALVTFVAWFLFSTFVGIGFVAVPLYNTQAFVGRPRILTAAEARTQRQILRSRAADLIAICEDLAARMVERRDTFGGLRRPSWMKRRAHKAEEKEELKRLRLLSAALESDLDAFTLGDPKEWRHRYNPLVAVLQLVGGIVAAVISLLWLVHIIVYMLFNPPLAQFLDGYLVLVNRAVPFFATLTIALLAAYLLLAAATGAFAIGSRLFLIKTHEVEVGRTLMNALYYNVSLIMLCSLPCVQFLTAAFATFAVHSDSAVIFGQQFQFIAGFRYFYQYNVFLFMLLGSTLLALVYFALFPSSREHVNKVVAKIRAGHARTFAAAERRVGRDEALKGGGLDSPPQRGRARERERRGASTVSIELAPWRPALPVAQQAPPQPPLTRETALVAASAATKGT